MAAGDALDQVTAEIAAQEAQRRSQRRVPAPVVSPPVAPSVGGAAPSPPGTGGPTFFQRLTSLAQNIVAPGTNPLGAQEEAGIGAGILRSPVTAAAGVIDTVGDIGGAISPRADIRNYEGHVSPAGVSFRYAPQNAETLSNFSKRINPVSDIGDPSSNDLASNVASVAVGYGAGGALLRFAKIAPKIDAGIQAVGNPVLRTIAGLAARAGGAGLADAVTMDPESERFSNILQRVGVHNEFIDWLAHDDGEGKLAGRFKNAIEGTGLTAGAEGLFNAARYWKARYSGDNASADAIQQQLAQQHDGEVPDYITHEMPGDHTPPPPEKPGYVAGWEEAEGGALRPVYEKDPAEAGATPEQRAEVADASPPEGTGTPAQGGSGPGAVDEQAGAGQRTISSGGEPPAGTGAEGAGSTGGPVRPMDPEVIAKAMGEDPVTYAAQRSLDEAPQIVGSADRGALDALGADVNRWKEAAANGESLNIRRPSDTADNVGEFNIGRFQSPEQVEPLLRALSDRIPAGRTLSDEELANATKTAASELGEDPATILAAAQNIGGNLDKAAEHMALLTTFAKRSAADVDVLAVPDWASADQATVDDAARRIYNLTAVWSEFQKAKSGLGRGLRVNQLPDADSYANTVKKAGIGDPTISPDGSPLQPLPRTRQEMQSWMDAWEATKGDPKLRSDFLEGALTRSIPSPNRYLSQSFANFFVASVLSAVKTHLLGFTGPTLMSIMRNTERLSGGYLAAIGNPFLSASERQANLIAARQASFNYVQALGQATDALHWASKSFTENASQLHGGIMFNASKLGPYNPALLEAAGQNPNDVRYLMGNLINTFPRGISRIYNFTDELTQRLAYYGEVRAKAIVEGAQQGLDGSDLQEFVRQKLKDSVDLNAEAEGGAPNPNYGAGLDQAALTQGQRSTFLGPVGSEGTWVRKVSDAINGLRTNYPVMRYILPVFNVPANILAETIRRSPLAIVPGFGFSQTVRELSGELGPVAQAEAHGRMLTGGAFLTAGYLLASNGLLTGAGPQEGTARKVWLQDHQPWSLRVGDSWVRLDRYDVAGALITIPATIFDETQYVKQDEKVGDLVMSGVGALAEWFKDRASMRTAATLFELGDDPTANTGTTLKQVTASTVAGFIPNILQTMGTQQVDTTLRRKQAWMDYIKAAVPGLSATLPPVRNVLGEPVQRAADTMGEAIFPVTIAPAVTYKEDPVINEIDRLYHNTGYAAGADPKALGYGYFHPQDVTLENGQSLYDAAMEARLHMKINGLTLRQSLGQLFNSHEYNDAVDADPGQKVTSRGDASRGYMVEQVFNAYNKQIKAELAEASPTANKWLTAAAAKQRDDAYLRDVNVEDLVKNPDYYQSHGIDPTVYSSKVREGATGALLGALQRR